jgi:EAL domain-containing protein (putative c-di-GMP-specific phosphodiesterase class I)
MARAKRAWASISTRNDRRLKGRQTKVSFATEAESQAPGSHRKLNLNPFGAPVLTCGGGFPGCGMFNELSRWIRWWEVRTAPPLISERHYPDGAPKLDGRPYRDGAPPICFVVDDEDGHRHFMSLVLQGQGIETGVFADAASLRRGLARRKPDLVFLNVPPVSATATEAVRVLVDGAYHGPLQPMSASSVADLEAVNELGRTHGIKILPAVQKPVDRTVIKRVVRAHKLDLPISRSEHIGLDIALRENWLEFWYQPKIDLRRKQLAGVELFARVRHPRHGILSPGCFLEGADEKSLMELLERSLIDALETGAKCAKLGVNVRLAVNVSLQALTKLSFLEIVRSYRPEGESWPGLILDLTEDQIASDFSLVRELDAALAPSGISLAIDDFGRGYLPLARLRDLPRFAELKLDRNFVANCASDKDHAAICKTVIDLAHNFGCKAVSVGLEKPADAHVLSEMGCDLGQGYLFAQPMAVDRFHTLLRQRAAKTQRAGISEKTLGIAAKAPISASRGPYG